MVMKGIVWEAEIVIFQTPLKPPQVPPWDPYTGWYAQETQINISDHRKFWTKILSSNKVYRWEAFILLTEIKNLGIKFCI